MASKRQASGIPDDPPAADRLSPRGCNTEETTQAGITCRNGPADPFQLKDPDKYRMPIGKHMTSCSKTWAALQPQSSLPRA